MLLHLLSLSNNPFLVTKLEAKTKLNYRQCVALVVALTREFVFIQGPLGTGKSYLRVKLIKVLLDVKRRVHLSLIVVV